MTDYVLVGKGIRLDPKRIKKDLASLQDAITEEIAEAIRLEIAFFIQQLRRAQSRRLEQLEQFTNMASAVAVNNPFNGVQARKKKIRGHWVIYVTRGRQDRERGIKGNLFNLLDVGRDQITLDKTISIPVFVPRNRLIARTLNPGTAVRVKTRRLKNGTRVAVFARKNTIAGFEGYHFYDRAVTNVRRKLIGKTVVKGELSYTISRRDFDTNFIFQEIKFEGE